MAALKMQNDVFFFLFLSFVKVERVSVLECLHWVFVPTSGIRAQALRLDPRSLCVRMSDGNDVVVPKAPRNSGDSFPLGGFLILSKTNYSIWTKKLKVTLEAYSVWNAIMKEDVPTKKDMQALMGIYAVLSEEILEQLDDEITAKETWEVLQKKFVGVDRVKKSRIQSLKKEFDHILMRNEELVGNFTGRFSSIVTKLRAQGEKIPEKEIVSKLLRVTLERFDHLTSSMEQFGGIDDMSHEEAIGSLMAHEDKIKERRTAQGERALLTQLQTKTKEEGECSHGFRGGRGRRRGRGRGRGSGEDGCVKDDNEKPRDRLRIKCYNCNKYGHYASQSRNKKKEEKANLAEMEAKETSLLIAVTELPSTFLLQGNRGILEPKGMWYLDTGATNHTTCDKSLFYDLIEKPGGLVRFRDRSTVEIEGFGSVVLRRKDKKTVKLKTFFYVPKLALNILNLEKLDNEGYDIRLGSRQLQVYDEQGTLLLHVKKNESGLYLHKFSVVSQYLMTMETCSKMVKWHKRYGHLNLRSLKKLAYKEMVRGLPKIEGNSSVCRACVAGKQHRQPFSSSSNYKAEVSV